MYEKMIKLLGDFFLIMVFGFNIICIFIKEVDVMEKEFLFFFGRNKSGDECLKCYFLELF